MNDQKDERTDKRKVAASNRHNLNNNMLIVLCMKFHYEGTFASIKTNFTKHFNLSGLTLYSFRSSDTKYNVCIYDINKSKESIENRNNDLKEKLVQLIYLRTHNIWV